jgi:hypothetical protein
MYNQHPNKEWSSQFKKKNLLAFTTFPLIVEPMRYTNEPGYISDTEDSHLAVNSTGDRNRDPLSSNVNLDIARETKRDEF